MNNGESFIDAHGQSISPEYSSSYPLNYLVSIRQILTMLKISSDIDIETYQQICKMFNQIDNIRTQITSPQILDIIGLEHIKLDCKVTNYKDKVDTLFFEADIPLYWILFVDKKPDNSIIHVTLLNYFVKEKVKTKLLQYLQNTYKNSIIVQ